MKKPPPQWFASLSSVAPKSLYSVALITLLFAAPAARLQAQANSASLNSVLSQMDAASQKFKNARADFRQEIYERVVQATTVETGSIYFQRAGKSTEMGAVIQEEGVPQPRVISYKDGELRMFDPGVNQITVLHAGFNDSE